MLFSLMQLSLIVLFASAFMSGMQALPVDTSAQGLTYNEYIVQPVVSLLYKVNSASLQQYIDSRFTVVSPFNDGSAYVVVQIGNMTAYFDGANCYRCITFTYLQSLDIYTIVQYNNSLYREVLALSFNYTPPVIGGQLYQSPPYGTSMMGPGLIFTVNNETGNYHFAASSVITSGSNTVGTASIDLSFNFSSTEALDYSDQGSLVGFYLGVQNNKNGIESRYRKDDSSAAPPSSISQGHIGNFIYSQIVSCNNVQVTSTYIKTAVGNMVGLDETSPAACFYAPYVYYNSVSATATQ